MTLGLAAGVVLGVAAEHDFTARVAGLLAQAHLDHARSIARYAVAGRHIETEAELVKAVEAAWAESELPYETVKICLIAPDGRFLLHTGRPDAVGTEAKGLKLVDPTPDLATVGDVLSAGLDWAGRQLEGDGSATMAAYAYEPGVGALVGINVRMVDVGAQIRRSGLPWAGALAALAGLLLPVSLLVLQRAWNGARTRAASLRDKERTLQARLAQTERIAAVGTLAAGVAHEINNPLTYVLGNLELLTQRLPPEVRAQRLGASSQTVGEAVEEARSGAIKVQEVIQDLRVLSRDEGSDPTRTFDPRPAVETAVRLAEPEVEARGRLQVALDEVPPVVGHPGRLQQVVLNLVINAAQALPDDRSGTVRVKLTQELDRGVAVRVEDDGRGMSRETMSHVFEPFFTTKPVGEGTGLGLYVARRLVESMGGTLALDSRPGEGTTAWVTLRPGPPGSAGEASPPPRPGAPPPRAGGADPRAPAAGATATTASTRGGRLLFVDDEPALRRLVQQLLEPDHEVVVVGSAEEALERLASDAAFDLVLCDRTMPGMGGLGLFKALEDRHPELVPRFVLTTGAEPTESVGEMRVLHKPFRVEEIEALFTRPDRSR